MRAQRERLGLAAWSHEIFPALVARALPIGVTQADANTAVFVAPGDRSPREHAAFHVVQYVHVWLERVLAPEDA